MTEEARSIWRGIGISLGVNLIIFLALVVIVCWAMGGRAAWGQSTVAVDLTRASLTWSWEQGEGGAVTAFRMKCGATTGSYTVAVTVSDPAARSMPLASVVTSPGKYFCAVSALNSFGESANSGEVSFDCGVSPVSPSLLQIRAN